MSGYFIEPDGHDELTLWRATGDVRGPESVVRRCDVGETAWGLLVAQVESPTAPVPAVPLTDAEREALAEVICNAHQGDGCKPWDEEDNAWRNTYRDMADAVLDSLAARPAPDTVPADRVRALADEWERERDACLAWLADPEMHVDRDHPDRLSRMADLLNRHAERLRALLADRQPAEREESDRV